MAKVRRDTKGRTLRKGESYRRATDTDCYTFRDLLGKRRYIYDRDLLSLRHKEEQYLRDKLDGVEVYALGRAEINAIYDRYIASKSELKDSTRTGYIYTYDKYVRETFGKKIISKVKYSDVLLFYKSLLDQGYSVTVVERIHCVLHPTFTMAVRDGILRNNPSDGVIAEIKKKAHSEQNVRHALSLAEERAFLDFLNQKRYERWKPFFIVMFGTGCRIGELTGLTWQDIDFDKNTISIKRSVSYRPFSQHEFKCTYEVSLPKTRSGIRVIPMLEPVRKALLEEKDFQDTYGMYNRMKLNGVSGFIFFNRYGNILIHTDVNKLIKRIVLAHNTEEREAAEREGREPLIIPEFTCHVARHTFCTRLVENSTNIKLVQSVMGHSDIQTTMNIYAEISQQKQQDLFEELNTKDVL